MATQNVFDAHGLSLPNVLTGGQLFAFSGFAGENAREQDWCGILTGKGGEIRFGGERQSPCILLRFTESTPEYDAVVSDLILADNGAILVTFADAQTLVGRSDMLPAVRLDADEYISGDQTVFDGEYAFSLATKQIESGFAFALCRRADANAAKADAQNALLVDADTLAKAVLDWYGACPLCPLPGYERLWYKCLSVNRVSVCRPQKDFAHYFTTSNRLRREMRAMDSCLHATAMAHYAPEFAKDAALAILGNQRKDGFIPHMMNARNKTSDVTFPPLLCMTIWNLFEITGDMDLLRQTAEPLRGYLDWNLRNRRSPNGLMTWHTQEEDARRRGEESGMDNSPRFDTTDPFDAIDFSTFMAYDLFCMQRIYLALGDHMSALQTEGIHRELADRINARLWDKQTQCYYDRTWGGAYRRILTPASFLPLFAGICDPRQAHCLVSHLRPLLACPFPIPSAIDEQGGFLTRDRWRGGVFLHCNFFVYVGLQRYGFGALAADLRRKTLEGVKKQFRETGSVLEFYDPCGENPLRLDRNGSLPEYPADLRCFTDSNLSACFIALFLHG